VTVTVCPPIVIVPVRLLAFVLAATVNETVPLPLPLVPEVIVMKAVLLAAVHAQPVSVVTATLPPPPPEENDWLAGETE
jgi:hypothetical protein